MDNATDDEPRDRGQLVLHLGEHDYLVRVGTGEQATEIRMHASPSVVDRITNADEARIIEATTAYLISRQRADDLPSDLDLADVAAVYDDYLDDLHRRLER